MATNEQLAAALQSQQEQLASLAGLLNKLAEGSNSQAQVLLQTQQQLQGFGGAFQVFAELVMAAEPAVRESVAAALSQALARPEAAQNETMRELLSAIHAAALAPPRTSPEGRRAGFQVIPGGEPPGEA